MVLGLFVLLAGVMHFVNPDFFNEIVPPWLPPSELFWTYASGVAELVVGAMLLRRSTRRAGAIAAIWLFVAVYPANLYMTWDWRDRAAGEQFVSWARLPLQFVLIWWAWRIARSQETRGAQPPQLRTSWKRPGPKGFSSGSPSTYGQVKQTTNGSSLRPG